MAALFDNPTTENPHPIDGTIRAYDFENGYTASVVQGTFSYGGPEGLWELAIKHGDRLVYDTPITNDVIGHLTEDDVDGLLQLISDLPPR